MKHIEPHVRKVQLQGKRIIVVEDDVLVGLLVENALQDAGANIVGSAITVFEALTAIEQAMSSGGINAAVLDLRLEGEPAWLVADALEELGVPFLFETAYAPLPANGYEAVPVLHKPYELEALLGAVEMLVTSPTKFGHGAASQPSQNI